MSGRTVDGDGIEKEQEEQVAQRAKSEPEERHEEQAGVVKDAEAKDEAEYGKEEAVELGEEHPRYADHDFGLRQHEEQKANEGHEQPDEEFLAKPDLAEDDGLELEGVEEDVDDGGGEEENDEEVGEIQEEGESPGDDQEGDDAEDESEAGAFGNLIESGDGDERAGAGFEAGEDSDRAPAFVGNAGPAEEDVGKIGVSLHDGDGVGGDEEEDGKGEG